MEETKEECAQFGTVKRVLVPTVADGPLARKGLGKVIECIVSSFPTVALRSQVHVQRKGYLLCTSINNGFGMVYRVAWATDYLPRDIEYDLLLSI